MTRKQPLSAYTDTTADTSDHTDLRVRRPARTKRTKLKNKD